MAADCVDQECFSRHLQWVADQVQKLLDHHNQVNEVKDNLVFRFEPPQDLINSNLTSYLLKRASLHKTLQGHKRWVSCVAFSPDGKLLASSSQDSTVRLWNLPVGEVNAELNGHVDWVSAVSFSPDGNSLVSSGDVTVRIWSLATKQQLKKLAGHSDHVSAVVWSPNGALLASGSWDKTIILWHGISSLPIRTLKGQKSGVWKLSFSQDGHKLISAGSHDKTAIIWDVDSGAALIILAHYNTVGSACFSNDGRFVVTACWDKIVRMFNANTGHEEKRFEGHADTVTPAAISFDGSMIVSGSKKGDLRFWDVASTKQLQQIDHAHTSFVICLAFSHDGKYIASGSDDATICLWHGPSILLQ